MLPLSSTMDLSLSVSLGLAALIGVGFGFFLEKAGFGSARKLVAVFYLYDMAVVKVMFTAIVTTLAGLFFLSSAGALNMAELYVEPTNYPAAVIGGLIFGGYCPGTSVTACATGRIDGLVFLAGIFIASYAYAEWLNGFDAWLAQSARAEVTLPSLTGLSMGWYVLAFVAALALAAWGMATAERRFCSLRPDA
jgi:hypothetical protein